MTTYFPISYTVPQYMDANGDPYSGAVLKAYSDGTSTPINLATDYTGATTVSTITLNASGYPAVSGNVVIPHAAENLKLALYPTAAAAAANTGAIWTVDNIQITTGANNDGVLTDVESAATVVLNSTTTNYFNITGTTTITGITLAEGSEVTVKFAGILTLTDSATLINLTGENITTAAGDIARFRGEAAGVVRMLNYERENGRPLSNSMISAMKDRVLNGLGMSNGTDATNDIDIAAGSCVSDDGTTVMTLSAITKQLDAAWAVGSAAGGLDTGAIANTTYHLWVINRPDTNVTDVLFSASASAPTLPASYTKKKCIGSIIRSSGAIKAFTQLGNRFFLSSGIVDVDAQNPGTSAVTRTLTVPIGVVVLADVSVGFYPGTTTGVAHLSSLSQTDQAVQAASTATLTGVASVGSSSGWNFSRMFVATDTSAQVRSRVSVSGANDRIGVITYGWLDARI